MLISLESSEGGAATWHSPTAQWGLSWVPLVELGERGI